MSHIVKINEYLDERIKFYESKMKLFQDEVNKNESSPRTPFIRTMHHKYSAIVTELEEVVKRVNGV